MKIITYLNQAKGTDMKSVVSFILQMERTGRRLPPGPQIRNEIILFSFIVNVSRELNHLQIILFLKKAEKLFMVFLFQYQPLEQEYQWLFLKKNTSKSKPFFFFFVQLTIRTQRY